MKEVSSNMGFSESTGWMGAPRLMLKSDSFRYGMSLALPPAVLGLPAASYAGMASVNMVWRLAFASDAPTTIFVVGGLLYGILFGVAFQCLLLGSVSNIVWRLGAHWLEPKIKKMSQFMKAAIWVLMEIMIIPLSFFMTMMAYGGPAFISWFES